MRLFSTVLIFIIGLVSIHCETIKLSRVYNDSDPLFLTPYIQSGLIAEAREAAQVKSKIFARFKSYSGFFTVNETLNKNLFSWFFPSKNAQDPLILWLQGGPGLTSLFGLFHEIGPFAIVNNVIKRRNTTWCLSHSILFIDNPVGTGYSFTAVEGLAHDELQIGSDLHEALRQFFAMFPEFRKNDFFVVGESYAGKYVPVIARIINKKNLESPHSPQMNLKGLAIGNGWLDPMNQLNFGEYTFQHGLVDRTTKLTMEKYRNESITLLHQGKFNESTLIQREIFKLFRNVTGFQNMYNYLHPEKQKNEELVKTFVQSKKIRKAIHVGNLTFNSDEVVDHALIGDIMVSVANVLADVLQNFRVLIYSGQLDLAVPYVSTVNYLEELKFDSSVEYKTAVRRIWYRNGSIAGYVKKAGNLTEMMILNAGHLVPSDQPEVAYDMITKFTRNITF